MKDKTAVISKAEMKDIEELKDAQISAFEEDIAKYGRGPAGFDSLDWQISMVDKGLYYKIMVDGKIVGGVALRDEGGGHMHLYRIFIDMEHQNQGIGRQTIESIESLFPNARKWTLDTPYLNLRNHHFYEKMGYRKIGETEPAKDNGFYLFLYEKTSKSTD